MNKLLLTAALLLGASPSFAADNFVVKDATGTTITKRSKDVGGGVQADANVLMDTTGTPLGTATNPLNTTVTVSSAVTNPTSTLTTPASATAYAAGQLVCTSATAATCNTALASEFFTLPNTAGGFVATRMRLANSDTTSTSYGGSVMQIDLWSAAPTMTNGDRGAFFPAAGTGQGTHLAAYSCTMSSVYGNGTYAECAPVSGTTPQIKLAAGTSVFWTLQAIGASGATSASATSWTAVMELSN